MDNTLDYHLLIMQALPDASNEKTKKIYSDFTNMKSECTDLKKMTKQI